MMIIKKLFLEPLPIKNLEVVSEPKFYPRVMFAHSNKVSKPSSTTWHLSFLVVRRPPTCLKPSIKWKRTWQSWQCQATISCKIISLPTCKCLRKIWHDRMMRLRTSWKGCRGGLRHWTRHTFPSWKIGWPNSQMTWRKHLQPGLTASRRRYLLARRSQSNFIEYHLQHQQMVSKSQIHQLSHSVSSQTPQIMTLAQWFLPRNILKYPTLIPPCWKTTNIRNL